MSLLVAHVALPGRLDQTDITLRSGELTALVGPNGGGKTSLLRALAGVEDAQATVTIAGRPLAEQRRSLAYMSAERAARWPIPVRDLLRLGQEDVGERALAWALDEFELDTLADRRADALSTGEQARVAMARVLLSPASVLLLDEPLANLDPFWAQRFIGALFERARGGSAILMSLHDLHRLDLFDRAMLVADRKVTADGSPAAVASSVAFEAAFRMDAAAAGVRRAGRRSSR